MQQRVIAYIDGFNLYYGLRQASLRRFYWLDVVKLCQNLLIKDQQLVHVKYFTSRISGAHRADTPSLAEEREKSRLRQSAYLDALGSLAGLSIIEGKFLEKSTLKCYGCGQLFHTFEEKMTDVNIATHIISDAHQDKFDTALLISADSDLVPPVKAITAAFPKKRIVAVFPPKRRSIDLEKAAAATVPIGNASISKSQLPDTVPLKSGHVVTRPDHWK